MLSSLKRWLTEPQPQPETPLPARTPASQAFKDSEPVYTPAAAASQPDYDDGFEGRTQVWIYLPTGSLQMLWVAGLEQAQGDPLNPYQKALLKDSICLEVHSLVRPEEYWKGSSHNALKKLPQMLGALPQDEPPMLVASKLADTGADSGVWLNLQITQEDRQPASEGTGLFGR
jgi:hypothetical protein